MDMDGQKSCYTDNYCLLPLLLLLTVQIQIRDIHVTVTFNAVPTVLYIESDQINTWQLVGKRNLHTLIK